MIAASKVHEVETLLRAKYPQREVARRAGVSRTTVANIAAGRSRRGPRQRYEGAEVLPGVEPDRRPFERCAGCGGKVKLPCALCAVRALPPSPAPEPAAEHEEHYLPPPAEIARWYESQRSARLAATRQAAKRQRRLIELER